MYRLISLLANPFVAIVLTLLATISQAQSIDESRGDFARQVYASSTSDVNYEAPQALLRAVVVLRVRLGDDGHWAAEVMRDNSTQPEMTQKALDSMARMPTPTVAEGLRDELHRNGFMEVWLFQNDGHFALKTLAKPQKGA